MKTLHFYISRELLKTFALTLVALTLLVTMGGGVANLFRSQGIDAVRVLKIFALLVPVAVTLVMPVAALFSATITFGRAAADNEINACRAAGINVHRLLLAPLLLSIVVAVFMYYSWNYFIPGLTGRIYAYGRQDIASLLLDNLRRNRGVQFGNRVLYADEARPVEPQELPPDVPPTRQYVALRGAAFLEMENNRPVRCGTTATTVIEFDLAPPTSIPGGNPVPTVAVELDDVRVFDVSRNQYSEFIHQSVAPREIPLPMTRKTRFEDLPTLRRFAAEPETAPDVLDQLSAFRRRLARLITNQWILRQFQPPPDGAGECRLAGPGLSYLVRPEAFKPGDEESTPLLLNPAVTEEQVDAAGRTTVRALTAPSGAIRVRELVAGGEPMVQIELTGGVEVRQVPLARGEAPIKKIDERLTPVPLPPEPARRLAALSDADLLDPQADLRLPPKLEEARQRIFQTRDKLRAEIVSNIQFRASYAAGTIAVVMLGAILGAILRGGQVLTAFGISCVPSLIVAVGTILGRNYGDQPGTHPIGIALMWAFNVLLAVAAVGICARYFKT
jgi:lipopolysaccharide export LptBFGC system permease protein LptF